MQAEARLTPQQIAYYELLQLSKARALREFDLGVALEIMLKTGFGWVGYAQRAPDFSWDACYARARSMLDDLIDGAIEDAVYRIVEDPEYSATHFSVGGFDVVITCGGQMYIFFAPVTADNTYDLYENEDALDEDRGRLVGTADEMEDAHFKFVRESALVAENGSTAPLRAAAGAFPALTKRRVMPLDD